MKMQRTVWSEDERSREQLLKRDAESSTHKEMNEFDIVRLTTDAYEKLGLHKGEIGTIMDVLAVPKRGYTVEFHRVPSANFEKVKTLEPHEIELVGNEFSE